MNNKKLIFIISMAILVAIISYFAFFRHSDHDGHDHGAESTNADTTQAHHDEAEENNAHEKMVHLNTVQYKNSGIDTGWFEQKNLSEVINANGYTKLPPQNQAAVSVQFPGNISTIKVIEGQFVKKGQVLATMQSIAYNNLRLERSKLNEQLKTSQANLEYLKLDYARQKELSEENVNAKKVFQKVSSELKFEEAKISGLQSHIAILNQNIQIGGTSTSPYINIIAPISGNITAVDVNIGSAAEIGKPLFSIVDNSKMHVDLLVYEKDLFRVKPGQNVRFMLTNQGNQEIAGKIFSVGKSFENDTKSVAVHADIVNEKQLLIPGMYVNALIDIGVNKVAALPVDAVIKAEGREFIFVLEKVYHEEHDDHGKGEKHVEGDDHEEEISFARIEVKTGTTQLGYVQVTPLVMIHDGDKIVVKGAYYLQAHLQKSEGGGGHSH